MGVKKALFNAQTRENQTVCYGSLSASLCGAAAGQVSVWRMRGRNRPETVGLQQKETPREAGSIEGYGSVLSSSVRDT
jgi:hypothetical protein